MNIRRRIEKLEEQYGKDDDILILASPNGMQDEVLADWMLKTGKPSPRLFIYLRRFVDTSESVK